MKFTLIDRVTELSPGQSIRAMKHVSLAEEYLADHFPLYPVLPGVMMLEALYQASMWLVHASEDFTHSMVVLKEARNIKYNDLVEPGHALSIFAEIKKEDETTTVLKAKGTVGDRAAVSGKLVLEKYNLVDRDPAQGSLDEHVRQELRTRLSLLWSGE